MGMSEGRVVSWYRAVGDRVEVDEPLVEVEAEKTTDDVNAPVAGTLLRILVQPGEAIPVRTVLALVGDPSEATDVALPSSAPLTPVKTPRVEVSQTRRGSSRQATPVARRLAKELGVDIDSVGGTGPAGRVTEDDVRRAAAPGATAAPETGAEREQQEPVPLTGMRSAIARRMHASLQDMAQLTLTRQMDVTDLIELRQDLKQSDGLSLTDLLLKAVTVCLGKHPQLNATLEDNSITRHSAVHLGVAVALDDGLIVPVIRDAQSKVLSQIAAEAKSLAKRVRTNQAVPAEVSGSTFTVTNLGALGIDAFTPIINPPEVAILGVGRVNDVLTRIGDGMAWRRIMTFSLTIDHRAVDGATGAQFLQTLAEILANPRSLTS
jgi:pyruvate dehydrogenase E2 component (dihydrolipoamide acetyltransferase)